MGAMFIGQQFLQNVLGYSTLSSGTAILPAALCMVIVAPRSAKLIESHGSRLTLLIGYVFCLIGFVWMLIVWDEGISYWQVAVAYAAVGIGVGLRRHSRVAFAHGLGSGQASRHGVGHCGPPTRSGRSDHAVDPGGVAHRRLRVGVCRRHRGLAGGRLGDPTTCRAS